MTLTRAQISRYGRQLILPEVGVQGQERLRRGSALLIGVGGLGCPAALYLAAAGVGRLGLVDRETVTLSNLHRQVLYTTADVGRPKSQAARERLAALNPEVEIIARQEAVTAENVLELVRDFDVVLDGSDNFATRYLVNDACVLGGRPLIYGGVIHLRGQLLVIRPRVTACFRCVFPEPPQAGAVPTCQEAGVLGVAAGVIGTLMAHEALRLLLNLGSGPGNRLLVFDGPVSHLREVAVRRDPRCAVCGEQPSIRRPMGIEESVCSQLHPMEEGAWRKSR